jgi:hypothetical protein
MSLNPSSLGATTQNYIGRSQYSADPYLNGRVDDFQIYDDALSAAEVADLATTPFGAATATFAAMAAEEFHQLSPESESAGLNTVEKIKAYNLILPNSHGFGSGERVMETQVDWWEVSENLAQEEAFDGRRLDHWLHVSADQIAAKESIVIGARRQVDRIATHSDPVDEALTELGCELARSLRWG